jgi:TIR domain/VHL beta domain
MPGIFLNYRRDDAAGAAGRLHDYLARRFPRRDLLMDVDAIEPGFDFVKQLETQVSQCDALLALIGPHWLVAEDEQGRRRLEDEKDYVRIEIASALKRGIPVIPVLLDGTPMPSQSELPDDLKSLTRRQALELRHTRFAVDADAIVSALKHRLPKKRKPWVGFLAAAACLIVGVGLGLIFYFRSLPTLPRASVGSAGVSTPATPMSCDQEKHLRSQATTESAEISFANRSPETRRIYWLNFDGVRVLYASLASGQTVDSQTYMTHPWLVANDADECKAIYMPTTSPREVDLN